MPRDIEPYRPLGELPSPCFFSFQNDPGKLYFKVRSVRPDGPEGPTDAPFGIGYQPTEDGNSVHIIEFGRGHLARAQAGMMAREEPGAGVWARIDSEDRIIPFE